MTTDPAASFLLQRQAGVLSLTLNRPNHGNSIAAETVPALTQAFREAQADSRIRCLVIGGAGKHFCSGGDVAAFARDLERDGTDRQADFRYRLDNVADLIEAVVAFDRPIIAALHGVVAGAGVMLALAADMVIGDETSLFLFSHQRIGLSPDGGVSYFLPRLVGRRIAARLVLTAARVDAREALAIGLLSEQVAAGELDGRVAALAAQFAKAPQKAVQLAKSLLRRSELTSMDEQLVAERDAIEALVASADFEEGVRAFIEKRAPSFASCADID